MARAPRRVIRQRLRAIAPPKTARGFLLSKALLVSLVLLVGGTALVVRVSSSLISASREQQSHEARAIAEAGVESTLGQLNLRYPYLLTNNHTPPAPLWSAPTSLPAAVCRNMRDVSYAAMPVQGTVTDTSGATIGDWEVIRYTFRGNSGFGGTGVLEVEGRRRSSGTGTVLARARVEQEVSVRLKDCTPAGLNVVGLLGGSTGIGNTAVVSLDEQGNQLPGQVVCTSCTNVNPDMNVLGDLSRSNFLYGFVPWPAVPLPPAGLSPWAVQLKSTDPPAQRQIRAGQERTVSGKKVCLVDSDGVTHCLISDIRLVGSNAVTLKVIQPGAADVPRQVRLYLQGDLRLGGSASLCQALDDGSADPPCLGAGDPSSLSASDLMLFGQPESSCPGGAVTQSVDLRGGAQALRMFAFLPCADIQVHGGSSVPDLRGAIWARSYLLSGNNNNVEIHVPPDLAGSLKEVYGPDFSLSIRRPVAVGSNRWSSHESIP